MAVSIASFGVNVHDLGAIADGISHPLSSKYATLSDAQQVYPFALSLQDELDGCAIQLGLNIVQRTFPYGNVGGLVEMPGGDYRINRPIRISHVAGLKLTGDGRSTVLRWYGSVNDYPIIIDDAFACQFERFYLLRDNEAPAAFHLVHTPNAPGGWINSANVFQDLMIEGFLHAFSIDSTGTSGDQNNELHRFVRVYMLGYGRSAVEIQAGQCHALRFYDCNFDGGNIALCAIDAIYGAYFYVMGGSGGGHLQSDFIARNFLGVVSIQDFRSEGSARLLMVNADGAGCVAAPVIVRGCTWNGRPTADGRVIMGLNVGSAVIESNTFNAELSIENARPRIYWDTLNGCGVGGGPSKVQVTHASNIYIARTPYTSSALEITGNTVATEWGNLYWNPGSVSPPINPGWDTFETGLYAVKSGDNTFRSGLQDFDTNVRFRAGKFFIGFASSGLTKGLEINDYGASDTVEIKLSNASSGIKMTGQGGNSIQVDGNFACGTFYTTNPTFGAADLNAGRNVARFETRQDIVNYPITWYTQTVNAPEHPGMIFVGKWISFQLSMGNPVQGEAPLGLGRDAIGNVCVGLLGKVVISQLEYDGKSWRIPIYDGNIALKGYLRLEGL